MLPMQLLQQEVNLAELEAVKASCKSRSTSCCISHINLAKQQFYICCLHQVNMPTNQSMCQFTYAVTGTHHAGLCSQEQSKRVVCFSCAVRVSTKSTSSCTGQHVLSQGPIMTGCTGKIQERVWCASLVQSDQHVHQLSQHNNQHALSSGPKMMDYTD